MLNLAEKQSAIGPAVSLRFLQKNQVFLAETCTGVSATLSKMYLLAFEPPFFDQIKGILDPHFRRDDKLYLVRDNR